jgi:hypothetical protein
MAYEVQWRLADGSWTSDGLDVHDLESAESAITAMEALSQARASLPDVRAVRVVSPRGLVIAERDCTVPIEQVRQEGLARLRGRMKALS